MVGGGGGGSYVGKGGTPVVRGTLPNLEPKFEMRNKTNNRT